MAPRKKKPEESVDPPEKKESPYTLLESLSLTRERLTSKRGWCQGKAHDGKRVCLSGAIMEVDPYGYPQTSAALREILDGGWLATFNDTHTHPQVLSLIDKAIKCGNRDIH